MLSLPCPFCGQRDETEFLNAGPAKPARPNADVTDSKWVEWLTVPVNTIGYVEEKWWHAKGCGKWFTIKRPPVTHEDEKAEEKKGGWTFDKEFAEWSYFMDIALRRERSRRILKQYQESKELYAVMTLVISILTTAVSIVSSSLTAKEAIQHSFF